MKRNLETVNNKLKSAKSKIAGLTTVVTLGFPQMVYAATSDPKAIVGVIADLLIDILALVGVFFVISGAFKLFQAYRSDNPEGQSAGAKDVVIGAVIVSFRLFVWAAIKPYLGI